MQRKYKCKCIFCEKEFYSNSNRSKACEKCLERELKFSCSVCGKEMKARSLSERKLDENGKTTGICKSCSNKKVFKENENYRNKMLDNLNKGREVIWSDDNFRKDHSERLSKRNEENWKDPVYREKQSKRIAEGNKKNWEECPEKYINTLKALKDAQERNLSDPEFIETLKNNMIKGHNTQSNYWNIFNSNDINNKDYEKAKEYCKSQIKILEENNKVFEEYWKIFKNNDIDNKNYEIAKNYCENQLENLKLGANLGMELKFCDECNKETWHIGNRCRNCHPWNFRNLLNSNWLSLSIEEKIAEEEKWIKENSNSKSLPYHKNNLKLLKLKQSGQYEYTFSNIENDPDLNNSNIGWIYGHIDIRNNELYYIGQTIRNPIIRYAEHLCLRELGLSGKDIRFNSADEYSKITSITKDRVLNTKVVVLYKLDKIDFNTEEEFRKSLDELEADCIKNFTPKLNFYIIENLDEEKHIDNKEE